MEHLWSTYHYNNTSNLPALVRLAGKIQMEQEAVEGGEAILLWVELQAVVQVLIQELALHFDPSQTQKLGDVEIILEDLNKLTLRK